MIVFVAAIFVAGAVGLAGVRVAQFAGQRRQRRLSDQQARRRQQASNPADLVYVHGATLNADLASLNAQHEAKQRDLTGAKADLAATPEPQHKGLQRDVRLACLVILPVVAVGGLALAVATFVALNNGRGGLAPLTKGIVAGSLEVLVALGLARLVHNRQPRELHWQIQLTALVAVMITITGYLAYYSPQRSAQQYGAMIDDDRRVVTLAEQSGQPIAVTAAKDKLAADLTRLRRAEQSDAALAVAIPLVEVLTAETALEGLGIIELSRLRRRRAAEVRKRQAEVDKLGAEIRVIPLQRTQQVAQALYDLGVTEVRSHISSAQPPPTPPRPLMPGRPPASGPGGVSPVASGPAAPVAGGEEPAEPYPSRGGGGLNLDGFAPPRPPPSDNGPEWDLAG